VLLHQYAVKHHVATVFQHFDSRLCLLRDYLAYIRQLTVIHFPVAFFTLQLVDIDDAGLAKCIQACAGGRRRYCASVLVREIGKASNLAPLTRLVIRYGVVSSTPCNASSRST